MKFNLFNKKQNGNKVGCDCACGCKDEARDCVRLTDAEIAEDVICELDGIIREYSCLCEKGCDCAEKLKSCRETRECLCNYLKESK